MDAIADAYRRALGEGELLAFPITALDHTDVPVWSVTRLSQDGAVANGIGYGGTDAEAQVSALGEATEVAGAAGAVPLLPRVRGSYAALAARGAVDPISLCLEAGSEYDAERELVWVPARRWRTGEQVLVPEEAVAISPAQLTGDAPLFTPITNGMGAGESVERAVLHGLLELVQRDGNSVSQRALDTGVVITDADGPPIDGVDVIVKACDCDLGIANVIAVGTEPEAGVEESFPLCVTAGGEAVHPDRSRAVRKAVLELCSSRARKAFSFGPEALVAEVAPERYMRWARTVGAGREEPRALAAMRAWLALDADALRERIADPVLSVRALARLADLPDHAAPDDPAAQLPIVLEQLAGFDPLWIDLSPPGGEIRVAKVLVPGLEVETASYGRIGERNLRRLTERDSPLVGFGAPPAGAARIHRPAGLPPAWLHRERLDALVGELYALYREPSRHATMSAAQSQLPLGR
jgi:ribosomal protein S12 methylthiotransferase accessory factor